MCCSRQYLYPSHRGVFDFNPSIPLEISVLVHTDTYTVHVPLNILAFETPPLPLGVCKNPPRVFRNYTISQRVHYQPMSQSQVETTTENLVLISITGLRKEENSISFP